MHLRILNSTEQVPLPPPTVPDAIQPPRPNLPCGPTPYI